MTNIWTGPLRPILYIGLIWVTVGFRLIRKTRCLPYTDTIGLCREFFYVVIVSGIVLQTSLRGLIIEGELKRVRGELTDHAVRTGRPTAQYRCSPRVVEQSEVLDSFYLPCDF
jgi:hypothetical protein